MKTEVFWLCVAMAVMTTHVIAQQPFDSQSLAQGRQTNAPRAAAARPAPRTADGKPDLSGFWRGPLLRNMDKNVPGGFKSIFTPAGAAAYERNRTKTINPEGLCLLPGSRAPASAAFRFRSCRRRLALRSSTS